MNQTVDMFLSIITINRNNAEGLRRTIDSVNLLRPHFHFEHIIIDGASNDDSLSVAHQKMGGANCFIISEPDQGIYDAMNKGAKIAKGEFLAFVNSGDELVIDAYLRYLFAAHEIKNEADIFYAATFIRDNVFKKLKTHRRNHEQLKSDTIPHLTTLTRRIIFQRINGFNSSYKICADRDFFIKAGEISARFLYLNEVVSIFELGGVSSQRIQTRKENLDINFQHKIISSFEYRVRLSLLSFQSFRANV